MSTISIAQHQLRRLRTFWGVLSSGTVRTVFWWGSDMNALRFLLADVGRTQRDLVEATSLSRSRVSRLASFPAFELGDRLSYYEAMEIQDAFLEWGGVDAEPPDFLALL